MSHLYDDLNNPQIISILDEVQLWSAPFGLKLLDVVRYKANTEALDIGCGLGFPLIELAMRLGNTSTVHGLDPWRAAVDRVRQKINTCELSNVEVVEGHAEEMPFADNYFDLIVSNNGINNVDDIDETFEECRRVSKTGAQFVFTFNTDQTFVEFYDVYHDVLEDCGLKDYQKKLSEHIYSKRKPVLEFEEKLIKNGFGRISIRHDIFHYRFVDATAMLNHFFMKLAFMPSWKELIPKNRQEEVFHKIEVKLNAMAKESGCFTMQVPFVIIDCEKR